MKLHYDAETDSLYIDLAQRPGADSREIAEGVVADFDAEGRVVGLDFQHASEHLDLTSLDVHALPLRQVGAPRTRSARRRA
jgi:uncharacterized protein YuzE